MYLVDTNILIWILRGKESYIRWFEQTSQQHKLFISTITVGEIYQYALPVEFDRTEDLLSKFTVWDVTAAIAKQGGLYWQQYIKKLRTISLLDCILAATAAEYRLTVVTLNTRHFPMSDIQVVKPL